MTRLSPIPIPYKGVAENYAFEDQPPGTVPDALNVWPHGGSDDRRSLRQRDGTEKWIADAINGTNHIQEINQVTVALNAQSVVPLERLVRHAFTGSDGNTADNGGVDWEERGESVAAGTHPNAFDNDTGGNEFFIFDSNQLILDNSGFTASNSQARGLLHYPVDIDGHTFTDEDKYVVKVKITTFAGEDSADNETYYAGIAFRMVATDGEYFFAGWRRDQSANTQSIVLTKEDGNTQSLLDSVSLSGAPDTNEHQFELRVNKNYVEIWWDGILRLAYDLSGDGFAADNHRRIGIMYTRTLASGSWGADDTPRFDDFEIWTAQEVSTLRDIQVVVVSGGNVYRGNQDDGFELPSSGSGALSSTVRVVESFVGHSGVPATAKMFLLDGLTDYKYYDAVSNAVTAWTATVAGTIPSGTSGGDTVTCRFGIWWQGRAVLSGLVSDPHNWFMSAIGDPFDWDYGAGNGVANAVAGTSEDSLGLVGDVITGLAPHHDGSLIVGCDHSISKITGNPLAGGRLIELSSVVGMAGPRAWAHGPNRMLFVFGSGGLYTISPNQFNIDQSDRISGGKLDRSFRNVNVATHQVQLAWDSFRLGLHIFITPNDEAVTKHYFWDSRTNSFWPMQIPKAQGPTAVHVFDADDPDDRAMILGGFDSQLRTFAPNAKDDDQTAISYLLPIGPIRMGDAGAGGEFMLNQLTAILASDSDALEYSVHVGDSAESAYDADATFSGSFSAGRNAPVWNRARGYAGWVKLEGDGAVNKRWRLESLSAALTPKGRARVRA